MAYYHSRYGGYNRKKKSKFSRFILIFLLILIIAALGVAYELWVVIFKPNTWVQDEGTTAIYIKTGSEYSDVQALLYNNGIVVNRKTFEWLAGQKNLSANIHPGKYEIANGMNNNDLINLLRSGKQEPVDVTFNNIRTKEELANNISAQIEADSTSLINLLNDSLFVKKFGFNTENVLCMFLPNTYEFYWNTTAKSFFERMFSEYNKFWTEERLTKASEIGLTPVEVSILASIVDKETTKADEMPTIAGVYLNRLKAGWRLQADPTIVYAWGDFSMRRVLNIHKLIESPYNTYQHYGLPPGPICIPSIVAIKSVLNREQHSYLYFCAKDDFSGYHVFAKTHDQHVINANKYRRALDEMNISN